MRSAPALHYRLPSRRAGSFGQSPLGRIAENLTLTWFRFELTLLWILVLSLPLAIPWPNFGLALLSIAVSPLIALVLWALIKLSGWTLYFVPGVNRIWGWSHIIFLRVFSKLVVERAPEIELPAWPISN